MEITTLCAVVATLRVQPSRSQFFQYENIDLSCEHWGNCSEWKVKRNTSTNISEDCPTSWDRRSEPHCFLETVYTYDSGVYWCECEAGERSNSINITVTGGSVILESPVLPVTSGDSVTLRCMLNTIPSSNYTTYFYKDEIFIGSSSTGNTTIHSVSKTDEGLYKCNISGVGESADSWLTVRVTCSSPLGPPTALVVLPVVVVCLVLGVVMLLCVWRRHKGKTDSDISYTDVIICTEEVKPQRIRDVDAVPTVYSLIIPGTT